MQKMPCKGLLKPVFAILPTVATIQLVKFGFNFSFKPSCVCGVYCRIYSLRGHLCAYCGYKVSHFNDLSSKIHYPSCFIFGKFCCAGMNRNFMLIYFINHAHRDYPTTIKALLIHSC